DVVVSSRRIVKVPIMSPGVRQAAIIALAIVGVHYVSLSAMPAPIRNKPVTPQNPADVRPAEITEALTRFEAGKPDEAFKLLEEASPKHPELPPARVMLANMYFSESQPASGRAELERA